MTHPPQLHIPTAPRPYPGRMLHTLCGMYVRVCRATSYAHPERATCKRCKQVELVAVLREYRMSNALLGDRSRLPDEQARTCREHIGDSRRDCTTWY